MILGFLEKCPFSVKNAPIIDYKNITLLQKYITETNKIITSKIKQCIFRKTKKIGERNKKSSNLRNNLKKNTVILLENISKLGKIGDLVKVKKMVS